MYFDILFCVCVAYDCFRWASLLHLDSECFLHLHILAGGNLGQYPGFGLAQGVGVAVWLWLGASSQGLMA